MTLVLLRIVLFIGFGSTLHLFWIPDAEAFPESKLQEYEEILKRLTDEMKRLMEELVVERSTGASFLQSEAGRRHIVTLERQAAKSAVDDFKENVMNRAMSVVVKRLLDHPPHED